ncbi:MAG: RsmE family RNA methyltransferase [Thermodesulfobacteriota bacterium]
MLRSCVNNGGAPSRICTPEQLKLESEIELGDLEVIRALEIWQPRCGEIITLADGAGEFYRARVKYRDDHSVRLVPFERIGNPESPVEIHVFQALPQKERFEWILQKLTEIGVTRIVPFTSEHSISLQERDARHGKSHRWSEVVRKAACQCRRARIPELYPVMSWAEILSEMQDMDVRILLAEQGGGWSMREALNMARLAQVAMVVGPEGGFSVQEIDAAQKHGILPVTLGARILRTETAALVGATLIQGLAGDYV